MRALLSILFISLASFAQAQSFADMSADERAAFGAAVRAYLLENPEVIMEAVDILQQREQQASAQGDFELVQRYAEQLNNDGFSFVGGNPDGAITLVEFLDYKCGYCRRAHAEIRAMVANNSDIRYIVKEFPILGDESVLGARAALAVLVNDGNDAYYALNDLLMTWDGPLNADALREMATEVGADYDLMFETMNSQLVTEMIASNRALAQRMQITGTPTFVLGPQMVRGYVAADIMDRLLQEIRQTIN